MQPYNSLLAATAAECDYCSCSESESQSICLLCQATIICVHNLFVLHPYSANSQHQQSHFLWYSGKPVNRFFHPLSTGAAPHALQFAGGRTTQVISANRLPWSWSMKFRLRSPVFPRLWRFPALCPSESPSGLFSGPSVYARSQPLSRFRSCCTCTTHSPRLLVRSTD